MAADSKGADPTLLTGKLKREAPYTNGICDGLRCVGLIRKSPLPTRNRLAFLTLDSVLEISLRIFLKHKKHITLDPLKHRPRHVLIAMAKSHLKVDPSIWEQVDYCYEDIRSPLYHQASDMTVTDVMLEDFLEVVCFLINEMFAIDAAQNVKEGETLARDDGMPPPTNTAIDPNQLPDKVDVIVLALGRLPAKDSSTILANLRSLGYTGKLTTSMISAYLSRGRYFYKDPADGAWRLTDFVGRQRLAHITEGSK